MPSKRKKIAESISRVGDSLYAKVQVGSGKGALTAEKAFELGTSIKSIKAWIESKRVELRKQVPTIGRGTIEAEVPRYLERCQKTPASLGSKTSEMKAWIAEVGHLRRHLVKPEHIDGAIAHWLAQDVAKKTILNRCRTLHHFYVTMADDKKARTPLDNITIPKPDRTKPAFVSVAVIRRVEKKLRAYPLEHAFYLVITSTGLRPAVINRMRETITKADVRAGIIMAPGGKGGEPIPIVLNADQRAAFKALLLVKDSGKWDATRYARRVRAAGWPAGIRPYNARHAVGIELAERDESDDAIQKQLGHVDIRMVRQHYTGVRLKTMRRISNVLAERRLGWAEPSPAKLPRKKGARRHTQAVSGRNFTSVKTA